MRANDWMKQRMDLTSHLNVVSNLTLDLFRNMTSRLQYRPGEVETVPAFLES